MGSFKQVNESWDRFLPNFKRKATSKRRKPLKVTDKTKKLYTWLPPTPGKSKVDKESSSYFMSKGKKERAAKNERLEKHKEHKIERQKEREKGFEAPEEDR